MRLFILSLLWRAAQTELHGFSEITIPLEDIERLREMVLTGNPDPINFYPSTFIQLSTLGVVHNHTAIAGEKHIPSIEGSQVYNIPIFRFYFDGLIIHIHQQNDDAGYTKSLDSLIIGAEEKHTITLVPYEKSFQKENLQNLMLVAMHK